MGKRAGRNAFLVSAVLAAALVLVGIAARGAEPSATPAPQPTPPSSPAPTPASSPPAAPAPSSSPEPAPAPLPRIVRVVCTDRICGNCDGKCHKNSGHVAIDKKGHCACTPAEGGPLDQATRQAYQKNQPQ
jgi:hypothetical protein